MPVERGKDVGYDNVVSLAGPLAIWIGIVLAAAVFQLFIFPNAQNYTLNGMLVTLNLAANYLLYIPGVFVLPMLASLWMGSRVGSTIGDNEVIMTRSLINAFYAAVVYLVVIFVVYILSQSAKTGVYYGLNVPVFFEYAVVVPSLICIVIVPLFALITTARKY